MPGWEGSDRRSRLPGNWASLRKQVLMRDEYRCVYRDDYGDRCTEAATDVDHIRPGDDHRDTNLQSLCDWHHKEKSGAEGAAGARRRRARINGRFRRNEQHPGLK